ncbi:hypothetical protein, partial [Hymenobacter lapidarius]|uniref:hypothetical protein n=1 Tax=Hymenobacter lapidarius TaxID=1908237 RepID=UPI001301604D
ENRAFVASATRAANAFAFDLFPNPGPAPGHAALTLENRAFVASATRAANAFAFDLFPNPGPAPGHAA